MRKFDADGQTLWTHQLGPSGSDLIVSVAIDASGSIVVAGTTTGNLGGSPANVQDALVRKLTAGGAEAWTRQFGTVADDASRGLAIGPGGQAIVAGRTGGDLGGTNAGAEDVFLRAYGP